MEKPLEMDHRLEARYRLSSTVLLVLGFVDLLRGVLHTFFAQWAVRTFAKLDLSVATQDQLTLLAAFGISNLLTGMIYILIGRKAKALSSYVLLAIPCAYAIGVIGMRTSGVRPHAAFYGKYFLIVYFAVCLGTVAVAIFRDRRKLLSDWGGSLD